MAGLSSRVYFIADSAQLRATIERLHAILSKRCDFEGTLYCSLHVSTVLLYDH